jgi:2-isopropylmalate synthase
VHAAAIIKAQRKGDRWLADRIYSGVPAAEFGKEQEIEVGPMSGLSNVKHWLARHEIPAEEPLARAVLARAKTSERTLTEPELRQIVRELRSGVS